MLPYIKGNLIDNVDKISSPTKCISLYMQDVEAFAQVMDGSVQGISVLSENQIWE